MRKILVTGATGFLGNYVVEELLLRKYQVIATSAHLNNAIEKNWFSQVTYFPLDFSKLNDAENYYEIFLRPDAMIHLAWEGLPNYKSSFHLKENLPRQNSFLKNMLKNGLSDLTVSGTCLEYGLQDGCLDESMEIYPSTAYAQAKNLLRQSIEEFTTEQKCDFKWLRLFYTYGNGQNSDSLLSQLNLALAQGKSVFNMSGGEQIRDFLPVEKMSAYIVDVALKQNLSGIVNCCSNSPVTVRQFVENYLKALNQTIQLNVGYYPYPDYEPMSFWGNNMKLNNLLNGSLSV